MAASSAHSTHSMEMTGDNKNPSLFIYSVFADISKDFIKEVFEDSGFGEIERIDMGKTRVNQHLDEFRSVYIHFKYWNETHDMNKCREIINRGEYVKVFYESPWFWKVFKSTLPKPDFTQKGVKKTAWKTTPRAVKTNRRLPRKTAQKTATAPATAPETAPATAHVSAPATAPTTTITYSTVVKTTPPATACGSDEAVKECDDEAVKECDDEAVKECGEETELEELKRKLHFMETAFSALFIKTKEFQTNLLATQERLFMLEGNDASFNNEVVEGEEN